jgi:hypothetical protein
VNSCSQNILIGAGGVRDHRPSVVLLGPELLAGAGLGPLFVLIFLVGLIKVDNNDTGVASGLVNVGQQVGGVIGLAIVGTVAWSAVASTRRSAAAAGWRAAARRQRQPTSPPQDQRQSDGTARLGESKADHEPSRMPPAGSDGRVETAALMTVAA